LLIVSISIIVNRIKFHPFNGMNPFPLTRT